MGRRKVATTVYITDEQAELLKLLSAHTGRPVAEYIREGIDLVLERHEGELPKQLSLLEPLEGNGGKGAAARQVERRTGERAEARGEVR